MIRVDNLWKTYHLDGKSKTVARDVSIVFPPRSATAIFGRNGAGKSTFLRILAGTQDFDSGHITRQGSISWPIGFSGSFHGNMTGIQNTRFVARISGVDTDELVAYVEDFAELGDHFRLPVRTYSSGMKARLAFGISMGIEFDTYLCDEVTATGDATFRDKSTAVFEERMARSGIIMVTHSLEMATRICRHGAVLENGVMTYFEDVHEAAAKHLENARRVKAELEAGAVRAD